MLDVSIMNSSKKKKKNSVFILTVYITNQLDFRHPGILIAFAILMRSISVNESILNEYTILPSWSLWATYMGSVENPATLSEVYHGFKNYDS